jgi:hypothetical protein
VTGTGCVCPALTAVVGDVVAAAIEFLTLENSAVTRVYDDWSCSSASWNGLKLVNDVGSSLDSLDDGPAPTREAISECEEATEVIEIAKDLVKRTLFGRDEGFPAPRPSTPTLSTATELRSSAFDSARHLLLIPYF